MPDLSYPFSEKILAALETSRPLFAAEQSELWREVEDYQGALPQFKDEDTHYFARKYAYLNFLEVESSYRYIPTTTLIPGIPIGLVSHVNVSPGAIVCFNSTATCHIAFNFDCNSHLLTLEKVDPTTDLPRAIGVLKGEKKSKGQGGNARLIDAHLIKLRQRSVRRLKTTYETQSGRIKTNEDNSDSYSSPYLRYNETLITPAYLANSVHDYSDMSHIIITGAVRGGLTLGNAVWAVLMQMSLWQQGKRLGIYYYDANTGQHHKLSLQSWKLIQSYILILLLDIESTKVLLDAITHFTHTSSAAQMQISSVTENAAIYNGLLFSGARYFKDSHLLDILLSKGATLKTRDDKDRTPIQAAAEQGYWDCVQVMAHRCDDSHGHKLGYALVHAVKADQTEVALALIAKNAYPYRYCEIGYSPLHWAASNNNKMVLQALLGNGASVMAHTARDETDKLMPLTVAIRSKARECITQLLYSGAIIEATNVADLRSLGFSSFILMQLVQDPNSIDLTQTEFLDLMQLIEGDSGASALGIERDQLIHLLSHFAVKSLSDKERSLAQTSQEHIYALLISMAPRTLENNIDAYLSIYSRIQFGLQQFIAVLAYSLPRATVDNLHHAWRNPIRDLNAFENELIKPMQLIDVLETWRGKITAAARQYTGVNPERINAFTTLDQSIGQFYQEIASSENDIATLLQSLHRTISAKRGDVATAHDSQHHYRLFGKSYLINPLGRKSRTVALIDELLFELDQDLSPFVSKPSESASMTPALSS